MNKRNYLLITRKNWVQLSDYFISEEDYFEYYQEANDPTFEMYEFKMKFEVCKEYISYYDTAINILKQKKPLSTLTWQDFLFFINERAFTKGLVYSHIFIGRNEGINLITRKKDEELGEIKIVWITKKYAKHRLIGVKIIRELEYLIIKYKATKGIIATTSKLTKEAIKLVNENLFIMSYIDNEMLEKELFQVQKIQNQEWDLPF